MKRLTMIMLVFLPVLFACTGIQTATPPVSQPSLETVVAATFQALTAQAPSPTLNNGQLITFNNVSFTIPNGLSLTVSPVISTDTEYPFIYPQEEPMPSHMRFEIGNYPITSYPEHSNEILVFNAQKYAAYSANLQETVSALITGQDAIAPFPESLVDGYFFAQAAPIRFQNGHGVRYLEEVLTGIAPINNQELFYYFQGITDDGMYFISARLHISASFLVADSNPNSITPPDGIPFIWDSTKFDLAKYYQDIEEKLNSSLPDAYSPSLNLLDALINSILVTN